jgi:hypothetical protein
MVVVLPVLLRSGLALSRRALGGWPPRVRTRSGPSRRRSRGPCSPLRRPSVPCGRRRSWRTTWRCSRPWSVGCAADVAHRQGRLTLPLPRRRARGRVGRGVSRHQRRLRGARRLPGVPRRRRCGPGLRSPLRWLLGLRLPLRRRRARRRVGRTVSRHQRWLRGARRRLGVPCRRRCGPRLISPLRRGPVGGIGRRRSSRSTPSCDCRPRGSPDWW